MEPNDQELDWKEVAFLLNGVNESLTKKIQEQEQEYAQLQAQHKRMQKSALIISKSSNTNF